MHGGQHHEFPRRDPAVTLFDGNQRGMEEKSREFVEKGAELYLET